MEQIDYPHPPHHWKLFTTPEALSPPDLRSLAKKNPEFYALGAIETFGDSEEKITPNYLADKRSMLR